MAKVDLHGMKTYTFQLDKTDGQITCTICNALGIKSFNKWKSTCIWSSKNLVIVFLASSPPWSM